MKVALCCIGRLENQYAVEFVEYHIKLGFDKIFVYDNNHGEEEHFEDVLQPFIDKDYVKVINFRDRVAAQLDSYNDCYEKYGSEYDWMAFFDFDEFLTLVHYDNIKDYLATIDGEYSIVKINWMLYTDNGLIHNDGRPLLERFTEPADYNVEVGYDFPENEHIKSIIRGGIKNLKWIENPHMPTADVKCCDSKGVISCCSTFEPYDFSEAYFKHFTTKTIEEWLDNKSKRGTGDRDSDAYALTYPTNRFFKVNKRTKEKEDFIYEYNKKTNGEFLLYLENVLDGANSLEMWEMLHDTLEGTIKIMDEIYAEKVGFITKNDTIMLTEHIKNSINTIIKLYSKEDIKERLI